VTNRPTMPLAAINTKRTTQLSICGSTPEDDFAEPAGHPSISLRDEFPAFQRGLIVVFNLGQPLGQLHFLMLGPFIGDA
jgi:hypothetical protein